MWWNKWGSLMAGILLVSACSKKSDQLQPTPQLPQEPVKGKLAKISYDSGAYDSLYYDASGKLIKYKSVWVPGSGTSLTYFFDYDMFGKPTRVYSDQGEEYRYSYENGLLSEVGLYFGGIKTRHKGFTYNQGQLTSTHTYADILSNPNDQDFLDMFTYTYYPDGNLKTETSFSVHPVSGWPVKEMTITYSDYDNSYNPEDLLKQLPYYFGKTFLKNNAGTRTAKNEKTGETSTYIFSYTYHSSTLPLTRKYEYYGSGNWQEGSCIYSYY